MLLRRLYSIPSDRFEEIKFKDGLNLILGHRPDKKSGGSLNGIGKSTLLDLVDFCLLASYKSGTDSRLLAAKEHLSNYTIALEFEVNGTLYETRRSVSKPNIVSFGKKNTLREYSLQELSPILCNLIFFREGYKGKYSNTWFRSLMPFFVKIHKHKMAKFMDPVEYLDKRKLPEVVYYHFFLLGIDNSLFYKNNALQADAKNKRKAVEQTKALAEEKYGVTDLKEQLGKTQTLRREIDHLEKNIEQFKMIQSYSATEADANKLTSLIKRLWMENLRDRKRIAEYKSSYELDDTFGSKDAKAIEKIYSEINQEIGSKIKVTLEGAIEFRKNLALSRKSFIFEKIQLLEQQISQKEDKIRQLEAQKAKALRFLAAKGAVKDLTEAYLQLSNKRDRLADLKGTTKILEDFEVELAEIKKYEGELNLNIQLFINSLQDTEIRHLSELFVEIFTNIHRGEDTPAFAILANLKKDAKVEIEITVPALYSKARNQGRTLIYDLMVLLNMIDKEMKGPRFLIHDGIFDGMDQAHFLELYSFIQSQLETRNFQYIATMNEDGNNALSSKLPNDQPITLEYLKEKESICLLTPDKKILGVDFDR